MNLSHAPNNSSEQIHVSSCEKESEKASSEGLIEQIKTISPKADSEQCDTTLSEESLKKDKASIHSASHGPFIADPVQKYLRLRKIKKRRASEKSDENNEESAHSSQNVDVEDGNRTSSRLRSPKQCQTCDDCSGHNEAATNPSQSANSKKDIPKSPRKRKKRKYK